ncbi:Hypothetical protein PP7435_CHR1-2357 [Komagataella phaffii CBS 7435]|uniref:Uncharacterized protein n=1 Tax=Komagataella phaffii (strain ATCC 76273 / CBS 7435 / CECT 11047 / NRRL Y-11430 / Wegner 21-1) TaxID=981350 RepID=A0A1G4KP96_KOMPC|nr:Hypothetical protein BQ9382_C1-3668 [Komagataella phaffii CBS 7435]SCV11839.1 Hypothetical protein PP7435_CHR1-2357 [Komagataella phaffii CBS 7435]
MTSMNQKYMLLLSQSKKNSSLKVLAEGDCRKNHNKVHPILSPRKDAKLVIIPATKHKSSK